MKTTIKPLTQRTAWKALAVHHKKIRHLHLRELFAEDSKRGERLTVEAAGLFLDYSKNRITDETLKLLLQLARESNLAQTDRRHVPRRKNQPHGKPRGPARRVARAEGSIHSRGRQKRRARGPRRARQDGRLSPTASAAARGRATPASPSATSSTSASAVPTSAR